MKQPLEQTWDLDVIFPGGSGSPQFLAFLEQLERDTAELGERLAQTKPPGEEREAAAFAQILEQLQDILKRVREAESFTSCLVSENQQDKQAVRLAGKVKAITASLLSLLTAFDYSLSQIPDELFHAMLERDPWRSVSFSLEERRRLAAEKLPPEQESLINELAVDGYHGWSDLYDTAVARFRFPYKEKGETVQLSAGQAANKLDTSDRELRSRLFRQWEDTWAEQADYCADALNHLAGFRLGVYKRRGWDSVHKEPLAINRMSAETLKVMWDTIERNKPVFVGYLKRKSKLLGVDAPAWHDVDAPIGSASGKKYSYNEAGEVIVGQFRRFSPKLADFAARAFESRWIEAEDRAGKRPGGFCTSFPVSGQTRIFMTYGGTASNVSTLAHELGHAYHQHVMDDLPAFAQEYAMNVAETASTFAELIVSDAAIGNAGNDGERLFLLDDKIQRAVAFYMNIHARFLFETKFYEERKRGLVGVERLNELMEEAQKKAYSEALSEYHPHFWAAKLHFYITDVPFYNFPYTFGFLFSAGIYARALEEGPAFEDKYVALLRDTASMTVEELAQKHLGADLTRSEFWQSAVDLSVRDVEAFMKLSDQIL